jgi:hypothetical protein
MQFAFAVAHQAFHDAQLDRSLGEVSHSGVILATAICDTQLLDLRFTQATNWEQDLFDCAGVSP